MFGARWWHLRPIPTVPTTEPRRRRLCLGSTAAQPATNHRALEDRQLLAVPVMTPHGGPILTNVQVVTVYWGWNAAAAVPGMRGGVTFGGLATTLDNFYSDITGSGYMADLAQYGAGDGTWLKQDMVAGPVRGEGHHHEYPDHAQRPRWEPAISPAFTGNQLYFVFLPPGMSAQVIAANGQTVTRTRF